MTRLRKKALILVYPPAEKIFERAKSYAEMPEDENRHIATWLVYECRKLAEKNRELQEVIQTLKEELALIEG